MISDTYESLAEYNKIEIRVKTCICRPMWTYQHSALRKSETRHGMSINRRKFLDFLSKFFRQVISWTLVHFSIGRWFAYLRNAVCFLSSFRYISRQFWRVVVFILGRRLLLSLCEKKFFRQRISCGWLTFIEYLSSCRTYLPIGSRRRPLSVVQLGNFSKKGFVCLSGGLEFLRTYLLVIWGLVSQLGNRVVC